MPGARLSLEESERITLGIASGCSLTGVAQSLPRPVDGPEGDLPERWSWPLLGIGR